MPPRRKEDGACVLGVTPIGKRPRNYAGTGAANLVGTGFPPAGLLGVSCRRHQDDARYGKVFLWLARRYTNGHCRARETARLIAQECASHDHSPAQVKARNVVRGAAVATRA